MESYTEAVEKSRQNKINLHQSCTLTSSKALESSKDIVKMLAYFPTECFPQRNAINPHHEGLVRIHCNIRHWALFFEQVTQTRFETCFIIGKRYEDILKTFVTPELQQCNRLQDTIFMQNVVPPHIHRSVKQVLRQTPTIRPPRSSHLTPCDIWLWGFIKDQVYREQPATLSHLKDIIIRHIRGINEDLLRSAVEHTVFRMEMVEENHVTHIE
ncbi:hypothetical protein AVEN_166204-1 [Araneus ventricosus]|uniref:Uncharacterized protein n=1 Tax=Araneus ventricosus TaxID=182803 RepID=A0A4Y2DB44_ARAVE|nr:hypothetical protein AVEN_166204-1 [Araneus ventricosus]